MSVIQKGQRIQSGHKKGRVLRSHLTMSHQQSSRKAGTRESPASLQPSFVPSGLACRGCSHLEQQAPCWEQSKL